jgi:hypothetical protein
MNKSERDLIKALNAVGKERFAREPGQTERVIATWAFYAGSHVAVHNHDHRDLVGGALKLMEEHGEDRVIFVPPHNPTVPPEFIERNTWS